MRTGDDSAVVEEKRPIWRNPWLIAFSAGALTLTLMRPCTRYIPDPPEVEGQIEAFTADLGEAGEASFPDSREAWVVSVLPSDCGGTCELLLERGADVSERLVAWGYDVPMLFIQWDEAPEFTSEHTAMTGVHVLRWPAAEIEALGESIGLELTGDPAAWTASELTWLAIVDNAGGIRGRYDARRSDMSDEVFHRTERVIMAERND